VKVRVAPDLCCGAQRCAIVAPEVYTLVDGYNALVAQPDPQPVPAGLEAQAARGARACPESAIEIIEGEG
jgi:ferredoxin